MLGQNVLVVDDESEIREVICRNIEELDFNILQAVDGEEALEIMSVRDIQIVLLDVMMPGISGIEMLEKINSVSPNTSVIIISGHSEKSHVCQALKNNVFDFLEKPIEMDVLQTRLINAYEQLKLKYMINIVVEHFLIKNFNLTPQALRAMDEKGKTSVLSQAIALIQIQNNKRQVA